MTLYSVCVCVCEKFISKTFLVCRFSLTVTHGFIYRGNAMITLKWRSNSNMQLHNSNNKCKIIRLWLIVHCQGSRMGKKNLPNMCECEGIFMNFIDFSRPPVISGSHTLQHPNKTNKHHDATAMIPQQQHPQYATNMRQMALGTQTLGRHHHSPNHMRQNSGKNQ